MKTTKKKLSIQNPIPNSSPSLDVFLRNVEYSHFVLLSVCMCFSFFFFILQLKKQNSLFSNQFKSAYIKNMFARWGERKFLFMFQFRIWQIELRWWGSKKSAEMQSLKMKWFSCFVFFSKHFKNYGKNHPAVLKFWIQMSWILIFFQNNNIFDRFNWFWWSGYRSNIFPGRRKMEMLILIFVKL